MLVGLSCHIPAKAPDLLRQPRWGDQRATWRNSGLPQIRTMTLIQKMYMYGASFSSFFKKQIYTKNTLFFKQHTGVK